MVTVLAGDGLKVFLFVEGGVVPDDGRGRTQLFAKHVTRPVIDEIGVGSTREDHGSQKVLAPPCGNQAGSRSAIAGVVAVNFLPALAPAVAAAHIGLETGFIDIKNIF